MSAAMNNPPRVTPAAAFPLTTRTTNKSAPLVGAGRLADYVGIALAVLAVMQAVAVFGPAIGQPVSVGRDLELYLGATRSLLSGGPFYDPAQLAGPYQITMGAILYPPSTIPLFVPFLWLPGSLWWTPLLVIAAVVWSWRPSRLGWGLIAVCLTFPNTVALILNGNPVMWAVAGVAFGTRFGWPYALALLKPSVAVVGLIGIREPRWWLAVGIGALVTLPFVGLWPDYLTALGNVRGSGLLYSLGDLPFVLVPLIAWLGSPMRRSPREPERMAVAMPPPPEEAHPLTWASPHATLNEPPITPTESESEPVAPSEARVKVTVKLPFD